MHCYQCFFHVLMVAILLMGSLGCSDINAPRRGEESLLILNPKDQEAHQLTHHAGHGLKHDNTLNSIPDAQIRGDIPPFQAHRCEINASIYLTNLHAARADMICQALADVDAEFHLALGTQYQAVEDDYNPVIDIYIFDNYAHYARDVRDLSGLTFNPRGGFFYEADPMDPESSSSIYTFVSQSAKFSVWNLIHEYSHHLNARFIKYGSVKDVKPYLFWEEGLAEYFSKGNSNPSAFRLIKSGKRLPLSIIFTLTYDTMAHDIYLWGYLAMRYFIQEEKYNLSLLINALRNDHSEDYENLLQLFADTLEEDFQRWLDDMAAY